MTNYLEKRDQVDLAAGALLVVATIYQVNVVPTAVNQIIRCSAIALLLILNGRYLFKIGFAIPLLILVASFPALTFLAEGVSMNCAYAFMQGINILALFVSLFRLIDKYGAGSVLTALFWILLTLSLFNDFTVAIASTNTSSTNYLLGNKFTTGGIHVLLIGIFRVLLHIKSGKIPYKRTVYCALIIESIMVLLKADAMTAMISVVSVCALPVLLGMRQVPFLLSGLAVACSIVVLNVVFFSTGMLLDLPQVQYFVQEVLGRSITMTGRTPIYEQLGIIIQMNPLFGWGYGNTVVEQIVGYGNAQNGIAQVIVDYGVVGAAAFAAVIISALPRVRGETSIIIVPLYGILYSSVISSLVEISFGLTFFFQIALVAAISAKLKLRQIKDSQLSFRYE